MSQKNENRFISFSEKRPDSGSSEAVRSTVAERLPGCDRSSHLFYLDRGKARASAAFGMDVAGVID
jgi:hypothetical protein